MSVAPLKRTVDPAARVYAMALADAAEAAGGVALLREVAAGLSRASEDWRTRRALGMYFLSPRVSGAKKRHAVEGLGGLGVPAVLRNFLQLLLRRNRLIHLPAIADTYGEVLDRRLGRMPVTLATAAPMPAEEIARWADLLRTALGKDPVVRHVVRPELVAGAVVVAGDVVADGSARRQLAELSRRIIETGHKLATQPDTTLPEERALHAPQS
jgi:F-type H+-transporting ATPase subunit delta